MNSRTPDTMTLSIALMAVKDEMDKISSAPSHPLSLNRVKIAGIKLNQEAVMAQPDSIESKLADGLKHIIELLAKSDVAAANVRWHELATELLGTWGQKSPRFMTIAKR